MVRVAVVGAGVIGLSTALNVQQQLPTARVTVIADKFSKDTTSDGAGGLFRPTLQHIKGVPEPLLRQWVGDSWRYFSALALSAQAGESGNSIVSGTLFYNQPQDLFYKDFIFSVREMTDKERNTLNGNYKYGFFATTTITEMRTYLPWLLKQFREAGGTVEFRTIESLGELADDYDIVANCSGLAAKKLVGDNSVYSIRGQLIKIEAPWIKHWVHTSEDTYLVPLSDVVVVGGVRQRGREDTEVTAEDTKDIMERATRIFPYIKGAKVVSEWAGLRPHRDPVRVEREEMSFGGRKLQVVHNYGHGGNGVSLSWGTSVHAAKLVKEAAGRLPPKARL